MNRLKLWMRARSRICSVKNGLWTCQLPKKRTATVWEKSQPKLLSKHFTNLGSTLWQLATFHDHHSPGPGIWMYHICLAIWYTFETTSDKCVSHLTSFFHQLTWSTAPWLWEDPQNQKNNKKRKPQLVKLSIYNYAYVYMSPVPGFPVPPPPPPMVWSPRPRGPDRAGRGSHYHCY